MPTSSISRIGWSGVGLSSRLAVGVIYVLALASGASGLILYAVANGPMAALVCCQLVAWWIALALIEIADRGLRIADSQSNPQSAIRNPQSKELPHDPQTQNDTGRDSGNVAGS